MTRRYIQKTVYFVLPAVLGLVAFLFPQNNVYNLMGTTSIILLSITLYLKPLSVLFPIKIFKILMTYRRELGLSTFYFFAFHGIGYLVIRDINLIDSIFNLKNSSWGILGGFILLIVAITSNDFAVKKLKKYWKKIQSLAYIAYFLSLFHMSLSKNEMYWFYVLGGIYTILKIYQHLALKKIEIKNQ